MTLFLRSLFFFVAALLVLAALALVATWAPDQPVEALKPRWAQPPSQFITIDGMQVHLRDEGPRGDPLPIVLIHGTSASLHTWEGWAAALRGPRRVIRFDLPGFALTGPNRQDDYSVEAYVRFVTQLVDQLGLQRFVLAGNSLGGQVAWATAAAMPQRVAQLVLVDASGYPPESASVPPSLPLGFRIARTPGLRVLTQYTLPRSIVEKSVRNVYGDPAKVTPELVDLYRDMTLRAGNRHALGRRMDQGYTGQLADLKGLAMPTLILWGGRDRLIPPEFGQRFARDIAGSRLVVFDDLGHVPHEEDPGRTVAVVKTFLGL
ncbi:MAG: alpha/beta hydrolase [Polaromonas sp.]|uniref:alpha/beta fold hydrolase n=1 Tax=Polaromonas sp. TaxID=1869339 RepID=UPI00271E0521|nr:alpha/beta hydrolase [Polaromonas sp.]MDO9115633.1 alpha/beta hydrolase [Polaromonas sp.]MDP1886800.1 alpha/beta hydrolase [Polaromonas sp.]MDP3248603.1 alpha/beta hydrolase [Polaromonas sp.]